MEGEHDIEMCLDVTKKIGRILSARKTKIRNSKNEHSKDPEFPKTKLNNFEFPKNENPDFKQTNRMIVEFPQNQSSEFQKQEFEDCSQILAPLLQPWPDTNSAT